MDFSSIAAFANSPASWGMASMVSAIGGRFVFSELTPSQQRIMRHPLTRRFVTFCMAFVTVVISSRLGELDRSLEEAAMDLGANRLKVFFVITLPIIAPALVSGWLLPFTLSLDDLVIASFTSGPGATTLPMRIYSQVRLGVTPEINAVCTLLIATVAVGVLVWSLAGKWRTAGAERRAA